MKNLPQMVGKPRPVFEQIWNKGMLEGDFTNPKTGKNDKFLIFDTRCICMTTFAVTDALELIITKQFRYGIAMTAHVKADPYIYELPGGGGNKG